MDPLIKKRIITCQGSSSEEKEDMLAVEKKIVISVQGKELLSLYCTPMMIKELVTGLFITGEVIPNKFSLENIDIAYGDEITVNLHFDRHSIPENFTTARCLGGFIVHKKEHFDRIHDNYSLTAETLRSIFDDFQHKSHLFRMTGCFHSAAISDGSAILSFTEDIGRHNAVDKVIGDMLLKDISFTGKVMLVSCRISSEIISKCARCGIPILVSRSAATDLSIEIAEISGITLIGFMRGNRFTIYTNPQRIITK